MNFPEAAQTQLDLLDAEFVHVCRKIDEAKAEAKRKKCDWKLATAELRSHVRDLLDRMEDLEFLIEDIKNGVPLEEIAQRYAA